MQTTSESPTVKTKNYFAAWDHNTLAQLAADQHARIKELEALLKAALAVKDSK